jgi:hypothetical protein
MGTGPLQNHPNPLLRYGGKVYSQNDEDGITFEILRRIGLADGVFAEFGVGNGVQNNTLALAASGWSGFWIGAQDLAFDTNPGQSTRLNFHFRKDWITRSNIVSLHRDALGMIRKPGCDLISIDLDGNDYYIIEELLTSGVAPKVFIAEYNGRFIPPIRFKIDYDDDHKWVGDDYFGASLASLSDLFEKHDYFLACCNITGANSFFTKNELKSCFKDVPTKIEQLYASPKYFLTGLDVSGHPPSRRTVEKIFMQLNSSQHDGPPLSQPAVGIGRGPPARYGNGRAWTEPGDRRRHANWRLIPGPW